MARTWQELFYTGEREVEAGPERGPGDGAVEGERIFKRLRRNLSKAREALAGEVRASFVRGLSDETWERLEEALILADVGASTTAEIVGQLEREAEQGEIGSEDELLGRVERSLIEVVTHPGSTIDISHEPAVILVVGVNGTGKTTTIGKVAWHLQREMGRSVVLAAADTFRAAAIEQLEAWAERAGCDIVKGQRGSDAGAVAFDAIEAAQSRGHGVVICDTAGRLHTEANLMEEMAKIVRVIKKRLPGAPHETLLVLDATTGQNGLRQAQLFNEAVDLTGVILTKLDGTARGGIALAVVKELDLPIKVIGTGEALEDLQPFDPEEFTKALLNR